MVWFATAKARFLPAARELATLKCSLQEIVRLVYRELQAAATPVRRMLRLQELALTLHVPADVQAKWLKSVKAADTASAVNGNSSA